MIIRIFASSVPTKPLNDAQMRGAFLYIYVYSQNTLMERLPHFTKHYMAETDLVALLESRGLIISDEDKAGLSGKVLGMFFLFHGILYLCIMNILEQLARLVLPKEILDNFDIVKIETDESNIDSMSMTIHLDERMNAYLQKSENYESKGFMDAVRITDFPIRDHKVILVLRRRRWRNKETGETFVDRISVTESGTRYSKEFAAFLKETYGHIPDDLPYA